ncbi:tubulin binding cofactor A [Gonapodya prolifera JEL478]|uniref:Tubulin-specific chaperone A n=1 Tax=Gonapodya prolifera (strain JEL478) TaxID=1344416 RepID=A0A139AM46_GONPJ|nr:tubulin binding cofactor A [Gonapodya prolifera JEL478]|eukprot:KXS17860.1 tubulin binding cofactor A [Gonapodya prolifera JEL478]
MATRDIKIKTGVLKRLNKELDSYHKEHEQQRGRIDKMVQEGKDEHDIRKQREVLEETTNMIPDCKKRLVAAYKELEKLVDGTCL